MAITINDKTYRNLPEQVAKNANDIEDLKTADEGLEERIGDAETDIGGIDVEINELQEIAQKSYDGLKMDHIIHIAVEWTLGANSYTLTLIGEMVNEVNFVGYINQIAGTSYTTIEEVKTAWPTMATALASGYGLAGLLVMACTGWINAPKTNFAKVDLNENSASDIYGNSLAIDELDSNNIYIGGSDITAYHNGGTFVSSLLDYSAL